MPDLKLFQRRQVWVPTWQGWILLLGLPVVVAVLIFWGAYPFLNMNHPIGRGSLVVEGWMSKRQMADARAVYQKGKYGLVICTGGPLGRDSYLRELYPDYSTLAEVGANQLRSFGLPNVQAVPRPDVDKDRTYYSALALRKWLVDTGREGTHLDVLSTGPHSRRSWMLFQAALEDVAIVGVIPVDPMGYDPHRWWVTSAGVRSMIGELIAYGYAKFLFYPNPEQDLKTLLNEGNSQ
jgi:hypothetical protein